MSIHYKKPIHNKPLPESENEDLMAFTVAYLENSDRFDSLIQRIMFDLKNFYLLDKPYLKKLLREKMLKGAAEHGSPRMPIYRVVKEKQDEALDLIGWTMVGLWNEKQNGG